MISGKAEMLRFFDNSELKVALLIRRVIKQHCFGRSRSRSCICPLLQEPVPQDFDAQVCWSDLAVEDARACDLLQSVSKNHPISYALERLHQIASLLKY